MRGWASQALCVCSLLSVFLYARAVDCPRNFTRVNVKCYYVSLEKATWHDAVQKCRDLNANLLVFDNDLERIVATKYLQDLGVQFVNSWSDSIWIGASAQGTNRRFVLYKNGAPLSYARWCFNQPDYNHQECVAYADFLGCNFGYHDYECLGLFPFVCENSAI